MYHKFVDSEQSAKVFTARDAAKLSGSRVKDVKRAFKQARLDCKSDPETRAWFGLNAIPVLVPTR